MRFCGQCTTALVLVCPKCSFENPPGFKFCGQCTTALTSGPLAPRLDTSKPPITLVPNALTCRAELQLKVGHAELAEADFRRVITLTKKMNAKSWELRATTHLARLLRDTNRPDEARARLAEIYDWFTEGFDTTDLKNAKALLDELNG